MGVRPAPDPRVLHREAVVVDLHNDFLLDAHSGRRDVTRRTTAGHSDFPRLREGGVDVQVCALFVHPRDADRGYQIVAALLDTARRLVAARPDLVGMATSVEQIEALVAAGRLALVLAVENASALGGDPDRVDALFSRGVRMMSLTWNASNGLADGALESRHGGLTPLGRRVLERMQAVGMVVDVSHLSERSFWDVLEATRGPVVATHSNAAGLVPHPRNLTDAQLRAIAGRGGVIGVNFYPAFTGGASLDRVLDHLEYLIHVAGPDHVALGSDFDGFSDAVAGLEDVTCLPRLTAALLERGHAPEVVRNVLGQNALRVFRQVWGR
ncbi:MAG: dipeptidase [Armatimonadota bacterium]|nr:dipeptidase [Armatimonadota bacterium]MDR7402448.1 dipeptidase [Armatimonadota bacterium]MDR7403771.1 dipeptidase [Armatimonadota bacterium]MDR7437900.1 dipeptidase [Armatimonadota bacterium]MDR7472125.1 dipeptidase [Armatimonadota bacterium]